MNISSFWLFDIPLFLCSILLALYLYYTRNDDYWKKKGIPYVAPVPFFGNLKDVFTSKKGLGVALREMYSQISGPFIGIYILDQPALLLKDLDVIKHVLVKDFNNFSDRTLAHRKEDLGSKLLPLMKNPDWKTYRKIMTPAYSTGRIKIMYSLVTDTVEELIKYINRVVEKDNEIDCKHLIALYGAELITSTAFGLKGHCFDDERSGFKIAAERIFDFNNVGRAISTSCYMMFPGLVHLFRLKFVDPIAEDFLRNVFWETVNHREKTNTTRNDFVDILIQMRRNDRTSMDDDKMLAQAITFFIAGFETTSTTISFALYELAKQPDLQSRVREEVTEVLKTHGMISYDVVSTDMPYVGAVVKETLRKYPPAPTLSRKSLNKYKVPGTDLIIDKGTSVYIPVYAIQMDPDNFPNPDHFDPSRFSEENIDQVKPFSFLAFGGGPRLCMGERFGTVSVKTALAQVIYNFEVELTEETKKPLEFHPRAFTLAPKSLKLPLKFKRIHNS